MAFNDLVMSDIKKFFEENESFTKKDLVSCVGKAFDAHKATVPRKKLMKLGKNKEGGEDKEKRQPTKYQLFVKTTLPTLKAREDAKGDGEEKLKQKDLIREVALLWKQRDVPKDDLKVVNEEEEETTPPPVAKKEKKLRKKGGKKEEKKDEEVDEDE